MASKCSGGRELTQFVANHFLGDVDGHMLAAVMNGESVTNELGEDGGGTAPGLHDALLAAFVHGKNFLLKRYVDIRTFFD